MNHRECDAFAGMAGAPEDLPGDNAALKWALIETIPTKPT
jgi:hypothetical protein